MAQEMMRQFIFIFLPSNLWHRNRFFRHGASGISVVLTTKQKVTQRSDHDIYSFDVAMKYQKSDW
ncbi:hypothetical protein AXW57_04325 [Yersinia ruckeri]|nr:hypothetical protein AXW57_04325 [Yersinia ruckeri]